MALGVLSCASKIVLAQADRDKAVHRLVDNLYQVYGFMVQDNTLGQISSMSTILGQSSQQTLACARFIRDYSETKNIWKRFGENVILETDDTIRRYSNVLDALMPNFRDQAARDVAIYIYRTRFGCASDSTSIHTSSGDIMDLSGMTYADGVGLDTRKRCLPGTRTDFLSKIVG